eukprot:438014_1
MSSSTVLFEEKLFKKGKIHKGWKHRWCVLKNENNLIILEYFDGKHAKYNRKFCGSINLSEAYGIDTIADPYIISLIEHIPDNVIIKEDIKSDKFYSFRIKTTKRKYVFAAFDQDTFLKWICLLDQIVYGNILKEGWLKKRGHTNKSWKKRYFVCNLYKQIKYYKDFNKKSLCGIIPLNKVNVINNGKEKPHKNKFIFHLSSKNRTWDLCAKERQQRDEWKMIIQKIIDSNKVATVSIDNNNKQCSPITIAESYVEDDTMDYTMASEVPTMYKSASDSDFSLFSDDDNAYEFKDNIMQPVECVCIESCLALQHVIYGLKLYVTKYNENDLIELFDGDRNILNDFHHILEYHLNEDIMDKC